MTNPNAVPQLEPSEWAAPVLLEAPQPVAWWLRHGEIVLGVVLGAMVFGFGVVIGRLA